MQNVLSAVDSISQLENSTGYVAIAPTPAVPFGGRLDATEIANAITHGLGLLLSLVAGGVLMSAAGALHGWRFIACAIYSSTMITVYAASTASHLFWRPRVNHFFRMLDQGSIYLFIAGTFTPIAATFL